MTIEAKAAMHTMHADPMRTMQAADTRANVSRDMRAMTPSTAWLERSPLSRLRVAVAAVAMTTLTLGTLVVVPAQIERHGTIGAIVAMWRPVVGHRNALPPGTPHAQDASPNGG
jgi:hypothetical protein